MTTLLSLILKCQQIFIKLGHLSLKIQLLVLILTSMKMCLVVLFCTNWDTHKVWVAPNYGTSVSGGLSLIFGGGGIAHISIANNTNTIGVAGTNGTWSGGSSAIQTSGTGGAIWGAGWTGCVIIVEYF